MTELESDLSIFLWNYDRKRCDFAYCYNTLAVTNVCGHIYSAEIIAANNIKFYVE